MPLILNIETATEVCSVALAKNGSLISIAESNVPRAHASLLTLLIQQVINESGKSFSDLDAIAVSKGPGSYTGLRIGVATAKGLCYALNKPLLAINTLQIMTAFFLKSEFLNPKPQIPKPKILFIPLLDARRMEVYAAAFDSDLNFILETKAEIIKENSFLSLLEKQKIFFFGNGTEKCVPFLKNQPNAELIPDFKTSSTGMIQISNEVFSQKKFEDIAYFEPFYLKDFIAVSRQVKAEV